MLCRRLGMVKTLIGSHKVCLVSLNSPAWKPGELLLVRSDITGLDGPKVDLHISQIHMFLSNCLKSSCIFVGRLGIATHGQMGFLYLTENSVFFPATWKWVFFTPGHCPPFHSRFSWAIAVCCRCQVTFKRFVLILEQGNCDWSPFLKTVWL